jgi:hypothetical protein
LKWDTTFSTLNQPAQLSNLESHGGQNRKGEKAEEKSGWICEAQQKSRN